MVGDIDVDKMEQKIKKVFEPIPMPANPAQRVYYPVADNDTMIVATLTDPEQPIMLVNLYMKRNATPDSEKNTQQYLRDGYIDNLISFMAGERLREMQNASPKPCLSATAHVGSFFISCTKDAFSLSFELGRRTKGTLRRRCRGSHGAYTSAWTTQSELERAKAVSRKAS